MIDRHLKEPRRDVGMRQLNRSAAVPRAPDMYPLENTPQATTRVEYATFAALCVFERRAALIP